ncbi:MULTISPECIES: hypothetical protein [unclassified Streptomyces]|uniref:hypothetical protein n=1 Tax=unclassified Streptomyces TaxID=2593676 RepID=UPI003D8C8AD9
MRASAVIDPSRTRTARPGRLTHGPGPNGEDRDSHAAVGYGYGRSARRQLRDTAGWPTGTNRHAHYSDWPSNSDYRWNGHRQYVHYRGQWIGVTSLRKVDVGHWYVDQLAVARS